jgi:outer membrane protein OmpA-like peptidoglycan-associated protein
VRKIEALIACLFAISISNTPASIAADTQQTIPPLARIQPVVGLVITSTVHSAYGSTDTDTVHNYAALDTENWYSVESGPPGEIDYFVRLGAPGDAQADQDTRHFRLHRRVRREDLTQSTRMTLFYTTADPDMYAGQTFAETSLKTLNLLKSGTEVPFVLGVISSEDMFGLQGLMSKLPAGQPAGGKSTATGPLSPAYLAGAFAMFSTSRDYYRGPLHRVESGPLTIPVLLNGERVSLPVIHASGTFKFGTRAPVNAEFWWLDSPTYPLTLKWAFDRSTLQVTRIDVPLSEGAKSGADGAISQIAAGLDKSCHTELSGIYFNTGSAVLLEESQPTLKAVAAVIRQSNDGLLTIEGHTDNIGSAQYNQDLSERRAAAVREALISKYGVPATRLTAKGYGLTRPVETNTTVEGRAHNRRVELSRSCTAQWRSAAQARHPDNPHP